MVSLWTKMWLTPEVKEHLIYWKNPRDSGIIFGFVLVFLLGIRYVSIISVLANMSLALITSTMAFRIYKSVLSMVNKTQDGHPFKVCFYHIIVVSWEFVLQWQLLREYLRCSFIWNLLKLFINLNFYASPMHLNMYALGTL